MEASSYFHYDYDGTYVYSSDIFDAIEKLCQQYWERLPEPKPSWARWWHTWRDQHVENILTGEV